MKLKEKTMYLLRDGTIARVNEISVNSGSLYRVTGNFTNNKEEITVSWKIDGRFTTTFDEHDKDVVKELSKEEYPELYL